MLEAIQKIVWRQPLASANGFVSPSEFGAEIHDRSACLRNSKLKRLTDVIGAGLGLLILLPLLALIALAVALDSNGPIIFRQRRSGLHGKVFMICKFRTMTVLEDGPDVTQARRNDNRVTWVGKFLRRTSLDELPQLVNVLKGDMSLVGPRPHAVSHDQYYAQMAPGYQLRFNAKPGITGLAQIAGFRGEVHDVAHMQGRLHHDLEYIENWSLAMDIHILVLTVTTAPFHPAAY